MEKTKQTTELKNTVTTAKPKKDTRYLNASVSRELHDRFEKFCKDVHQTKTRAIECAIEMYMDYIANALNLEDVVAHIGENDSISDISDEDM